MDTERDSDIEEIEAAEAARWAEVAPFMADFYTERELRLMLNCIEYRDCDPAGLPGHNLMILVAKLAAGSVGLTTERVYELMEMKKDSDREEGSDRQK